MTRKMKSRQAPSLRERESYLVRFSLPSEAWYFFDTSPINYKRNRVMQLS